MFCESAFQGREIGMWDKFLGNGEFRKKKIDSLMLLFSYNALLMMPN